MVDAVAEIPAVFCMDQQRGTTLLELLVAMSLLALIAVYGLSAVRFLRNFDRIGQIIERQDLIDAAADHMRVAIAGARAVSLEEPARQPELAFRGGTHDIAFVTAADPRLEYGGLSFVRFRLEGQSLVALRQPFRASLRFDNPTVDPILLADGIGRFELAYYGAPAEGESPRWFDAWRGRSFLPKAVRLSISPKAAPQPVVLTIVVATGQESRDAF